MREVVEIFVLVTALFVGLTFGAIKLHDIAVERRADDYELCRLRGGTPSACLSFAVNGDNVSDRVLEDVRRFEEGCR